MAAALGACGGDDASSEAKKDDGAKQAVTVPAYDGTEAKFPAEYAEPKPGEAVTLGMLNPSNGNEIFRAYARAFAAEGKRLGAKTTIVDNKLSVDKQVSDFELLLGQNVDALFVYPLDPGALAPMLARAKRQKVPVIGGDVGFGDQTKAEGFASQVWVGRDHEAFLQAAVLKQLRPNATTGLITFSVPVPTLVYLRERQTFWGKKFGLKIQGTGENPTDDTAGGATAMNALLSKSPDIEAVIAYNDPSALGAYTTARSAGGTPPTLIGLNGGSDGLEAVESGRIQATVKGDAVGLGTQAARAAYIAATGKVDSLPPVVALKPVLVTPENVGDIKTWDEEIAELESAAR